MRSLFRVMVGALVLLMAAGLSARAESKSANWGFERFQAVGALEPTRVSVDGNWVNCGPGYESESGVSIWLSPDPDWLKQGPTGLNPYQYAYWNPIKFTDPDGRNPILAVAFVLLLSNWNGDDDVDLTPVLTAGAGKVAPTLVTAVGVVQGANRLGEGLGELSAATDAEVAAMQSLPETQSRVDAANTKAVSGGKQLIESLVSGGGKKGRDNAPRSDLPREKGTGNYLPHPHAQGAHSTVGTRKGSDGKPYRQGATFDENGNFKGRTDVSDHGRADHSNPHFHPATGPASVGPHQPVDPGTP